MKGGSTSPEFEVVLGKVRMFERGYMDIKRGSGRSQRPGEKISETLIGLYGHQRGGAEFD
jgi:hypothetical protein